MKENVIDFTNTKRKRDAHRQDEQMKKKQPYWNSKEGEMQGKLLRTQEEPEIGHEGREGIIDIEIFPPDTEDEK